MANLLLRHVGDVGGPQLLDRLLRVAEVEERSLRLHVDLDEEKQEEIEEKILIEEGIERAEDGGEAEHRSGREEEKREDKKYVVGHLGEGRALKGSGLAALRGEDGDGLAQLVDLSCLEALQVLLGTEEG